MNFKSHRIPAVLLAMSAITNLAGCDYINPPKEPPPSTSMEAVATRDAPPELVFKGRLGGEPAYLLVHDCAVFQVEPLANGGVKWTKVLEPDLYPLWTSCERESLSVKGGVLTVKLGRRAFAAGGCCATGGVYRSVDGRNWKQAEKW